MDYLGDFFQSIVIYAVVGLCVMAFVAGFLFRWYRK